MFENSFVCYKSIKCKYSDMFGIDCFDLVVFPVDCVCVQNCEPAFYFLFGYLSFERAEENFNV